MFTVMLPDMSPEDAVQALHSCGYDGVEWRVKTSPPEVREPPSFWGHNLCTFGPTAADAVRARSLAASAQLEIPNLGTYIAVGDLGATETVMRFAAVAGAPQLRVGAGYYEGSFAASVERAQAYLREVEVMAKAYGVKALIEIHHQTICPSASLAYRLVSDFDPEHIGVIYDPGNMAIEGFEDYRLGLELLGPYLAHVHVKNARYNRPDSGGVWNSGWAPLEDGMVDFTQLFNVLRATGYAGWLTVEDFSAVHPSREALEHNFAFIQQLLGAAFTEAAPA